jgi:hypothetical protein
VAKKASKKASTKSKGAANRSTSSTTKRMNGGASTPRGQTARGAGRDPEDDRIAPRTSAATAHEAASAQRAVDPELRDLPDEALDLLDEQLDEGDELADVRAAMAAPDGAVGQRVDGAGESHRLAAGDVDADAAETGSGEEAAGGSTPTPDQDSVDQIGEALGVTYQPDEPLNTTEKIARRDDDRWELNPSSSEDFAERRNLEHALPERPRRTR